MPSTKAYSIMIFSKFITFFFRCIIFLYFKYTIKLLRISSVYLYATSTYYFWQSSFYLYYYCLEQAKFNEAKYLWKGVLGWLKFLCELVAGFFESSFLGDDFLLFFAGFFFLSSSSLISECFYSYCILCLYFSSRFYSSAFRIRYYYSYFIFLCRAYSSSFCFCYSSLRSVCKGDVVCLFFIQGGTLPPAVFPDCGAVGIIGGLGIFACGGGWVPPPLFIHGAEFPVGLVAVTGGGWGCDCCWGYVGCSALFFIHGGTVPVAGDWGGPLFPATALLASACFFQGFSLMYIFITKINVILYNKQKIMSNIYKIWKTPTLYIFLFTLESFSWHLSCFCI